MAADAGTLGWGTQAAFLADVRMEAARQNAIDLLPMLAGQAAALVGEPAPAAEIVALLVEQTRAAAAADRARRGCGSPHLGTPVRRTHGARRRCNAGVAMIRAPPLRGAVRRVADRSHASSRAPRRPATIPSRWTSAS